MVKIFHVLVGEWEGKRRFVCLLISLEESNFSTCTTMLIVLSRHNGFCVNLIIVGIDLSAP